MEIPVQDADAATSEASTRIGERRSADSTTSPESPRSGNAPPVVALPKSGGAIRGIGEKFAANPVTGTGSMTVPIPVSPGRSGFGPQLTLSYDSGTGNSSSIPLGLGWTISLPSITRKTEKGLPRYDDANESDVFILSGSEDLVPVLKDDNSRFEDSVSVPGYTICRYRPRIEGLFARIERWTDDVSGEMYWRSISRDNITTWYGRTAKSRVSDPDDPTRVFSWLICASYDDKGNAIVYEYVPEDSRGVDLSLANEGNRTDAVRGTNRYLRRIKYGNCKPNRDENWQAIDPSSLTDWMFDVVFDYGDIDHPDIQYADLPLDPTIAEVSQQRYVRAADAEGAGWPVRPDPFSAYRATFEVRTYRRCRRVLMFHNFPELPVQPCLVRSTEFDYDDFDYSQPYTAGDEAAHKGSTRTRSIIRRIIQSGYVYAAGGMDPPRYLKKSLPPLEFEYTDATIDETVIDAEGAENLPAGVDGTGYQWVDLDGEGLSGALADQGGTWFYKRNISALPVDGAGGTPVVKARFEALERVDPVPVTAGLLSGSRQFLDLAGDGHVDVVELDGPTPGFYERTRNEGWKPFAPFASLPNLVWKDPNLRFVDLTGDGLADILITEDDVFTWYPSLGEEGFAAAERVPKAPDEEKGPRLVFADGEQSIYLADMSGDGLQDLVRIRNGSVEYWGNCGYSTWSKKVAMDNAPWFDTPDQFDQKRIRLADIDGSGTTDIIYLGAGRIDIYRNQSGNCWTNRKSLTSFPPTDNLTSVTATDLLGNGTACLVWSSPLASDAARPMRYIDLMGGEKPHLLVKSTNNLGAETRVSYAPSTRFYLQDRYDGKPWITKLPFPVQVVERVETCDHVGRNWFVTRYAYHHGYFDGFEREFRGFGMVEQWDTEKFEALAGNASSAASANVDAASHVPPVLTRTWFHTGVYLGRDRVSNFFAGLLNANDKGEYYREPGLTDDEAKQLLLDDTVMPEDLPVEEEREACRALKGSMLRQEVYALDGTDTQDYPNGFPYTVTEQNFGLVRIQGQLGNRHAVFFVHPRETIGYQYERKPADPRTSHAMTLAVDPRYGQVLKSLSIGYGRRPGLTPLSGEDKAKQEQMLVTYTENDYTNTIDDPERTTDDYRPPLPSETRTYEVTGFGLGVGAVRFAFDDFAANDSQTLRQLPEVSYEVPVDYSAQQKRLIEQVRTLYRPNDMGASQNDPLALLPQGPKSLESLALPGETYKIAFTPGLLDVYSRGGQTLLPAAVGDLLVGGGRDKGGYVQLDGKWWIPSGRVFYSPAVNSPDDSVVELLEAREHFFVPRRYRDPFHIENTWDTETRVDYDGYDLLVRETRDALGNRVTVGRRNLDDSFGEDGNDYRVLKPGLVMDPNRNCVEVKFDALGLVVGTAVMGKPEDNPVRGDWFDTSFGTDLTRTEIDAFYGASDPHVPAPGLLQNATTRIVYDLDRFWRSSSANPLDPSRWEPAFAATLARETHASEGASTRIQLSFSYSDGFGREIQKKIQAERGKVPLRDAQGFIVVGADGQPQLTPNDVEPRWVGSGWTVFNNKGKPVRQFEPFFSDTHRPDFDVRIGVSPVLVYDPVERVIATLHPNDTYEKVVFDPWIRTSYDVNDTVAFDPRTDTDLTGYVEKYFAAQPAGWDTWLRQRIDPVNPPSDSRGVDPESDAAVRALAHRDTPMQAHFDSLGRVFLTVADNGPSGKYETRVELDIKGNQRTVRDALQQAGDPLGRIVMRYDYDMLGNRVHQLSMEAGGRWMLNDVAGKPLRAWDSRGHNFTTNYDALRRPIEQYVRGTFSDPDPLKPNSDPRTLNRDVLVDKIEYGELLANAVALNLRTRVYRHFDSAGVAINARLGVDGNPNEAYDFKGNLLRSTWQLVSDYKAIPDWLKNSQLDAETFEGSTRYDALNRPIQAIAPHSSLTRAGHPNKFNVIQPVFNEAKLLERVDVWLERAAEPAELLDPNYEAASPVGVADVDYDAKGRRLLIGYKNGASTFYSYDPLTFRLTQLLTKRKAADFPGDDPQPPRAGWSGEQVQNLHYTYDPAGNITHIQDDAQQTIYFRNQRVEPSNDYIYDALYRLIQASGREHLGQGAPIPHSYNDTGRVGLVSADALGRFAPNDGKVMGTYIERYVYDAVGNFLQIQHRSTDSANAGWTRAFDYLEASLIEDGSGGVPFKTSNRLTSTTLNPVGNTLQPETYLHDAHGNMLRMPHLGGGLPGPSVYWDYKDQLRQTDLGGGGAAFYLYDASGQRVRKVWEKALGLTEERIYLGGFEIFRKHGGPIGANTATLERETLHVMDDKQRIALVETRTLDTAGDDLAPRQLIRYQFGNHVGTVSLELDKEAQIVSYEEYAPYGSSTYQAVRSQTETSKRYRYIGKERDEETGLNYHGARYYAVWLPRWISCDPSGVSTGINLYLYASDNPVVKFDPNGLWDVNMHFGAVYWAGRLAGADHQTALRVAIASQSLDDYASSSAPEMKGWPPLPGSGVFGRIVGSPTITDFIVNRANNAHALHVSRDQSRMVADFGIRTQNETTFGMGLHTVGDYLPHANLSGEPTMGHQVGVNEDESMSSDLVHDADYTYKNPQKAYATFESFRGLWEQYLGKTPATDVKEVVRAKRSLSKEQFDSIAKFINTDQTKQGDMTSALTDGLRKAGVSDTEIATIVQLMDENKGKELRRRQFEQQLSTEEGARGAKNAWHLFDWIGEGRNSSVVNSGKADISGDLVGLPKVGDAAFDERKQQNHEANQKAQTIINGLSPTLLWGY
jgi:RHS repeat-associated protein